MVFDDLQEICQASSVPRCTCDSKSRICRCRTALYLGTNSENPPTHRISGSGDWDGYKKFKQTHLFENKTWYYLSNLFLKWHISKRQKKLWFFSCSTMCGWELELLTNLTKSDHFHTAESSGVHPMSSTVEWNDRQNELIDEQTSSIAVSRFP